jgi:hypothetical protein
VDHVILLQLFNWKAEIFQGGYNPKTTVVHVFYFLFLKK